MNSNRTRFTQTLSQNFQGPINLKVYIPQSRLHPYSHLITEHKYPGLPQVRLHPYCHPITKHKAHLDIKITLRKHFSHCVCPPVHVTKNTDSLPNSNASVVPFQKLTCQATFLRSPTGWRQNSYPFPETPMNSFCLRHPQSSNFNFQIPPVK